MAKLLQSPWTVLMVAMTLYAGSTFMFWKSPKLPKVNVTGPDGTPIVQAPVVEHGPSWDFSNPEVDLLVRELRQERAAIAARSKQLDLLAARLQAEQAELRDATQAVHQLQRDFDLGVARVKESEAANLKRLARVYSTMEPDGASAILKQLDEVTVVKVLSFMKEDQIAAILTAIARTGDPDTRRVAVISERLRLLQARSDPSKARP
ncbi:MAG: MotE family protein [Limisphaerales bacterium]